MDKFLTDHLFLRERIEQGIDIHPSDDELKEFQRLAKLIDPQRYFTIYGCQSCCQALVKFVYDNQQPARKVKMNFPKQIPPPPEVNTNTEI